MQKHVFVKNTFYGPFLMFFQTKYKKMKKSEFSKNRVPKKRSKKVIFHENVEKRRFLGYLGFQKNASFLPPFSLQLHKWMTIDVFFYPPKYTQNSENVHFWYMTPPGTEKHAKKPSFSRGGFTFFTKNVKKPSFPPPFSI
jgi:hypothetical protein